jgi:NMD protein affecting ribosome stability and mRNA decay
MDEPAATMIFCPVCGIQCDRNDADAGIAAYGVWDGRCSDCQLTETDQGR